MNVGSRHPLAVVRNDDLVGGEDESDPSCMSIKRILYQLKDSYEVINDQLATNKILQPNADPKALLLRAH